jgi:hypothetical protein
MVLDRKNRKRYIIDAHVLVYGNASANELSDCLISVACGIF